MAPPTRNASGLRLLLVASCWLRLGSAQHTVCTEPSNTGVCTGAYTGTSLDLNGQSPGLTGTIPTQLGLLSSTLTEIKLSTNDISGTVPSEIVALTGLSDLTFASNSVSGTLPTQIALMSDLTSLTPGFNLISGTMPSELGVLSKLEYVSSGRTSFSGSLPLIGCLVVNT